MDSNLIYIGIATISAGVSVLGAAFGIGKIGSSAMKAISRQPEIADKIQNSMIISCALIEGAALFGIVTSLLTVFK
ncbi:ATP synthase F0 subunit C [Candidatus Shikimatogenerans silvanidophilus]|uniref:ATP synthase F0 subunit C n=1 Tax=Candidatus Shikimatogenerans silvanidophilus TaxID=2782547 RepID=UPI001BACFD19|nr:ATP synthase F0 subunit C [Candidatus Shikimatogenerans silvanidophilus]